MYAGRILVADNNPLCRGGLVALLRTSFTELELVEAEDFAALAKELTRQPIVMVVLDVDLPGLNAIAGLRLLRMRYPAIRVVALSWADDGHRALNALAAGAHGYIPKTLSAADMLHAFQTVLDGQVYAPTGVSEIARKQRDHSDGAALTERQMEVIRLLSAGQSNKEIARSLNIAEGTVKVHVMAAFRLLGVHNRVSAAAAIRDVNAKTQEDLPLFGAMPDQVERRAARLV
ncbi:MAG: response regulator transcription factor [Brevundimonas sp.]|nr:MAG: response regulator transcription factor [Brevundimonas sp.]